MFSRLFVHKATDRVVAFSEYTWALLTFVPIKKRFFSSTRARKREREEGTRVLLHKIPVVFFFLNLKNIYFKSLVKLITSYLSLVKNIHTYIVISSIITR